MSPRCWPGWHVLADLAAHPLHADTAQQRLRAGLVGAGFRAVLVPFSIFSLLASRVTSSLLKRLSPARVLTVACAPMLLALLLFSFGRGGGLTVLFIVMGLAGLGTGCNFSVMPQLIVDAVPQAETGSAISFNQVSRLVGYSAGSALSAIVLESATHDHPAIPTDSGYTEAGLIGAALWVITAGAATILPGRPGTGNDRFSSRR